MKVCSFASVSRAATNGGWVCRFCVYKFQPLFLAVTFLAFVTVTGCSSQPVAKDTVGVQQALQKRTSKDALNARLASMAIQAAASGEVLQTAYHIGPGDLLNIAVFGVDELNTTVRVSSKGNIMLPLVGELNVEGRSPQDVENMLVDRLYKYMHNPEASVFVAEYRSQRVSVTGAVNNPGVQTLTQPRTVLELLSLSGGLSPAAGDQIYVQTTVNNKPERLIIDLDEVLSDANNKSFSLLLHGGDSIFVPKAGVVFVEGAVNTPGAYPVKGQTGVLEAIAMARGTTFDARPHDVQVITRNDAGERIVVSVPLDEARANETPDLPLHDGDIVVVPSNSFKRGFATFWQGFRGVFGMGYSLNGP